MCCGEAYLLDEVCEAGLCGLVVEHELLLVLVGDLDPLECVCGDGLGGDVRQVHAGHGRLGGQARASSRRIDLDACDALSGANSNDIAVMCLRDAAAIDIVYAYCSDVRYGAGRRIG